MRLTRPFATTITVLALCTTAAHAEITTQDVWNNWQTYASAYSINLTADVTQSGSDLHLANMRYTYDLSPGLGRLEMLTGATTLTANSDGTVALIQPDTANIKFILIPETGPTTTTDFTITIENHTFIASGSPTAITYDFTAETLGLTFDHLSGGNPNTPFTLNLVFDELKSSSTHTQGSSFNIFSRLNIANTAYFFETVTPEETYSMHGTVANIDLDSATTLPNDGFDLLNLPTQLRAGLTFDTTLTTGQSTQTTTTKMDTKSSGFSPLGNLLGSQIVKMAESNFALTLSKTGLSADTRTLDYAIDVTQSGLPFAIHALIATTKTAFSIPLLNARAPQDFALTLALENLRINDGAWDSLDPENVFPRTPATLAFDLSGKARVLFEFLDFRHLDQLEARETPPIELTSLTLNSFTLFAAMTELTAAADFTFDNTDLTIFPGIPAPQGTAELRLSGANALLDALIKSGLIQDSDAMGARMAMGIFMKADTGDDTLTSTIEINEQGHISANGQRLK